MAESQRTSLVKTGSLPELDKDENKEQKGTPAHLPRAQRWCSSPSGLLGHGGCCSLQQWKDANDPRATKLAPGEAFILSRPKGAKQWEHRRVLGPAAQQYFAD